MPKSKPAAVVPPDSQYRIAAVSRLAGIPVSTIRMWERRYSVVTPARSAANGRLYSRADIERLMLLKSATDAGHAIGTIAQQGDETLRARLQESPGRSAVASAENCRVLVCGGGMTQRLRAAWAARDDIHISASLPGLSSEQLARATPADAVIVETATLQSAGIQLLRELRTLTRARVMIVVYGFGNRQSLARLDQEGIIALALPAEPAHLARICHLGMALQTQPAAGVEWHLMQPVLPRRYDDAYLATVARLPTTVSCECPNHLADLLTRLNAFEQYSLECESADVADASIHSLLYTAAAQCRGLLEHALHRVLEHENIADPTVPPAPAAARR